MWRGGIYITARLHFERGGGSKIRLCREEELLDRWVLMYCPVMTLIWEAPTHETIEIEKP